MDAITTHHRSKLYRSLTLFLFVSLAAASAPSFANTIDFDDFALDGSGVYNGSDLAGGFTIDGKTFSNNYTEYFPGCCWDGFAVSNHGDTTTMGFGNQYSSITGGGYGGGGQFGMIYTDSANITLASAETMQGTYLTNGTYPALSMQNGDGFAKQFGGVSGLDEDWFNITIEGLLAGGSTGSVTFYLADYRSANPLDDYIVTDWTYVDLSSLGLVDELQFSFDSSDVGEFGLNTPTYAAIDFITSVPEPSSGLLCAMGLLMLARRNTTR